MRIHFSKEELKDLGKETFKNLGYISPIKHAKKSGGKCSNLRGSLNHIF